MKQLRGFQKRTGAEMPEGVKDNPQFAQAMQKYGGMDEDALIVSLLSQIETAKKNGSYNPAQMESYVKMLSPHLSQAQREKLHNIMRVIENEE